MRKVEVQSLSALKCTLHLHLDEEHNITVLVVSFDGEYGVGSQGNGDAAFMSAETLRALAAFDAEAIVLDFRRLAYSWGNALLGVFQSIDQYVNEPGEPQFPVFVVSSDLCRGALLGLMGTDESEANWHFSDMNAALDAAAEAGAAWLDA